MRQPTGSAWKWILRGVALLVSAAVGFGSGIVLFAMSMAGAPTWMMVAFALGVGLPFGFAGPLWLIACCAGMASLAIGDFGGVTLPIFLMVGSGSVGIIARTLWDERRSALERAAQA